MTRERWQQIDRIFQTVIDLPADQRATFLDQACAGDSDLRERVEAMLHADSETDVGLDQPAYDVAAELLAASNPDLPIHESNIVPGRQIGHYQIVREIGRGGMGRVYLASDTRLGRQVALKLLLSRLTNDPARVHRFQREARAASGLNHPNILTIYDFGETDGQHFIASELVEGQTLRSLIVRGDLELSQTLEIIIQAASALSAAHQAGIIHRDIKPENLMLRPDGYVKVLDFGLAKLTEVNLPMEKAETKVSDEDSRFGTKPGAVMGTVSYMSPEQARGQKVDARSDIFSLGVLFYEMVTGTRPFQGATANHVLVAILDQQPPPIEHYFPQAPANLQLIVSRTLAKKREDRYQSSEALLADLRTFKEELVFDAQLRRGRSSGALATESGLAKNEPEQPAKLGISAKTGQTRQRGQTGSGLGKTTNEMSLPEVNAPNRKSFWALAIVAVLIIGLALGLAFWLKGGGQHRQAFLQYQSTRLSIQGNSSGGVISPDGKYVVYLFSAGAGKGEIRLKQIVGGGEALLAATGSLDIWGIAFSPDGNSVYYVTGDVAARTALYQVPVIGGKQPRLLPGDVGVFLNQSISPDGGRVLNSRGLKEESGTVVSLVNLNDGATEPFAAFPGAIVDGLAWAADGKTVAYAVRDMRDSSGNNVYVAERPVGGGAEKIILPKQPLKIRHLAWLPDRSGLLALVRDGTAGVYQLSHISYPDGAVRRITQNTSDFMALTVTNDGRKVMVGQVDYVGGLRVTAMDALGSSRVIVEGLDPYSDIVWTPDGQLIYNQNADNGSHLWRISAGGGNAEQLTAFAGINHHPSVTADGRYVVFASTRAGSEQLWRINSDGSHPVQLTTEGGTRPRCSPDGRWIVYENSLAGQRSIWKISIDGGVAAQVMPFLSNSPSISPDGKLIACEFRDLTKQQPQVVVIPFAGLQPGEAPVKTFDLNLKGGTIRWAPDGKSLLCAEGHLRGFSRFIKIQSLAGGAPRMLAELSGGDVFSFDLSPDGKHLAYSSGQQAYTTHLITDIGK